jgi:hypothetical protein
MSGWLLLLVAFWELIAILVVMVGAVVITLLTIWCVFALLIWLMGQGYRGWTRLDRWIARKLR